MRSTISRLSAVLALSVLAVGLVACGDDGDSTTTSKETTTTAKSTTTEAALSPPSDSDIAALTAKIAGGGASFPDAFYQAVNTDFNGIAGNEIVTYAKSGSSDGRQQLAAGTLDFAGSDSLPKPEEDFGGKAVLFFPSVAAPITVSYNLTDVEELRLSPDTVAAVFQGEVTTWDDPAIAADNPDANLPATKITVVHRSDGSGTTNNFTKYLTKAAPEAWKLGSGDTVNWPASTQGAEKNSGVAASIAQTDGAIGYVDLADALKADLQMATIQNASGEFVGPTADGVKAAVEAAEVSDNLTYDPLNSEGEGAYPITAPTYILAFQQQSDAAKAATLTTWLRYMLTTGQKQANGLGYVGLPEDLAAKAVDQIDSITS